MEIKRVVWAMWLMVCGCFISQISWAKSVYVISNTNHSVFQVYNVQDNELVLKRETQIGDDLTIGLAIDESANGTFLFATYEFMSFIRVIDAKSMELIKDVYLPHAANLAGIAYDSERNQVYVVDRLSNHLYSYSWNSRELSLQPEFNDPYYLELEEIEVGTNSGAIGLALDMTNDRLYISDVTNEVKYYNVNDWFYGGSISLSESAIGIAVDPTRELLLYGNMGYVYNDGLDSIGRYDLAVSDPNLAETFEYTGAAVGGITFDPDTGYVFTTLFGSQDETVYPASAPQDSVQMFCPYDPNNPPDPNLTLVWDSPDIGNPSGIAFSDADYKPSGISIVKSDNLSVCAEPEDFVTYTIAVHSKAYEQTHVVVTDVLPYEADFVSADPNTGTYFPQEHVYIWDDITLPEPNDPGDPNVYLEITVQVNYGAEPSGQMVNKVTAESAASYDTGQEYTDICCDWAGDVIYVDKDAKWNRICFGGLIGASGYNSGTSWDNAYRDLQDALERAQNGCGSEIWVAQGTYHPSNGSSQNPESETFEIPDNVSVYGGFKGDEISRDERNVQQYKTILNGYAGTFNDGWGGYYDVYNNTVVKPGDGSLLDGVTVTDAAQYGVYSSGKDFTLENCTVENNEIHGIYVLNGDVTLKWCEITDNEQRGIHHYGGGKFLRIENCKIHDNHWDGILAENPTSTILNSLIYQNGSGSIYYGINLLNPPSSTVIRNNTIVQNVNEGIRHSGSSVPTIKNCIVYYNNDEGAQLAGLSPTQVTWCSISDCNDINSQHNINDLPGFVYADPNGRPVVGNYHLVWNSPCVDTGDSDEYTDELDIDGDSRVYDGTLVDRGADEVTCTDTSDPNDWNADGVINMEEFAIFSVAWLSHDPNDTGITTDPNYIGEPNYVDPNSFVNWDARCDLDDNYAVDLADLILFCEDAPQNWLWIACWKLDEINASLMMSMPFAGNVTEASSFGIQTENAALSMPATPSVIPAEPVLEWSEGAGIQSDSEIVPVVEEKSIEEQILDLQDSIQFLEQIWTEESDIQQQINADDWKQFMDSVYQSLTELQTQNIQTE